MTIHQNNALAARVIHPGFAVADELAALNVSQTKASKAFEISKTDLQKLCNGELDVTPAIAAGLERLGSAESAFWLQLQDNFNTHPKRGGARVGAGRKKKSLSRSKCESVLHRKR
jgi:addiction module HigA family antidote